MSSIQVAESSKPKKGRKVLDYLEIHPRMGGGNIVRHHYTNYEHEPLEVHFNEEGKREGKGGGEHIVAHLMKHAALPAYEKGEEPEPEPED